MILYWYGFAHECNIDVEIKKKKTRAKHGRTHVGMFFSIYWMLFYDSILFLPTSSNTSLFLIYYTFMILFLLKRAIRLWEFVFPASRKFFLNEKKYDHILFITHNASGNLFADYTSTKCFIVSNCSVRNRILIAQYIVMFN